MRYRRYRVFVAFAGIALFALYHFGSSSATWRGGPSKEGFGRWTRPQEQPTPLPVPSWRSGLLVAQQTQQLDINVHAAKTTQALQHPPPVAPVPTPNPDDDATRSSTEVIHWKQQTERFPVPSSKIIKLPSAKPKPIPKIQHAFGQESAAAKAQRERKLDIIKGVFMRSWDGYREYAWLQDELCPVSGRYRNPFAGWGATLVDSLDTLWIMGLKQEFDEAAKAVDKIDFTTTHRSDIPLFETTIRYLGGLLGAYEISGRGYGNLLNKAVELAEVLISAFDTPNRMPHTSYYWSSTFLSRPDRASDRATLSEIGSLSLEFTRLAQLTGKHKYYDAIARITDHLEEFQNKTRLPGMWPTLIDASGCKIIVNTSQSEAPLETPIKISLDGIIPNAKAQPSPTTDEPLSPNGKKYIPLNVPSPIVFLAESPTAQPVAAVLKKRQLDEVGPSNTEDIVVPSPPEPECEYQGFVSATELGTEEYTLGGMGDSTYEYLPKEWLLLGGQVDKYRIMYEQSAAVVKDNLIFRPMLPKENDILFSGKFFAPPTMPDDGKGELEAESAHLTCFAGGMFGMGAKIFNRPEDLEIAKKLTEGCIFSYNMTQTGIMPEAYIALPCESIKHCQWNESRYWDVLDPNAEARITSYESQMVLYEEQMASASAWNAAELASMTAAPMKSPLEPFEAAATPTPSPSHINSELESGKEKRQPDIRAKPEFDPKTVPSWRGPARNFGSGAGMTGEEVPPTPVEPESPFVESDPTGPIFPAIYSPLPPLTRQEYVKKRLRDERLPPGVISFPARNYILRPEAIESVWYMYRITGEPYWREAGWRMFEAIENHTATTYGNSAIADVTQNPPHLNDEMESFFLAETLKYFYLLFSDESVVSLDEWVLNTEAHPFRRPT